MLRINNASGKRVAICRTTWQCQRLHRRLDDNTVVLETGIRLVIAATA